MAENYDIRGYMTYMDDVLSGKIVAGKWIRLACKRMKDWFSRDDIYFDFEDVDNRVKLIWKMKHSTGEHNGKHFELLPWQLFVVANIYGWKWKSTGIRVTRNAFIMISRKNGKTALAAALTLCTLLCDRENDAEADFVANNSKQAGLCFKHTNNFAESLDPNGKLFKRYRGEIRIPITKSLIQVMSSDSMGLDGFSSSTCTIDEIHAQKNWDLYNVMKSSMGARRQPLMLVLTTAGFLLGDEYPCYSMWHTCCDILQGLKEDDTQFSAIYQLDEGDDWTDEDVWTKCCPSLDQTVFRDYMREQVQAAKNNTSLEVGVKTKNFNMWTQSATTWISRSYLEDAMEQVNLDDFYAEESYCGVDLSAVSDLTCWSVMFPPNPKRLVHPDKFVFKSWIYIPQEALELSQNKETYKSWMRQGLVHITSGNVVDYDVVLKDQLELNKKAVIYNIGYDDWNAVQYSANATYAGLPMQPYSQGLGSFNKPTKAFEMLVKSGKVVIDNSTAVLWMFANVELKTDWNENIKPVKAQNNQNNKIDVVISMLEALGTYFESPRYSPEVWSI